MELIDFLTATSAPVPFKVDGIDSELHCKPLTIGDINAFIRECDSTDPLAYPAGLLAMCVVSPTGEPLYSAERWRNWPRVKTDTFNEILENVQRINGMLKPEEAKDLGKGSSSTAAPA